MARPARTGLKHENLMELTYLVNTGGRMYVLKKTVNALGERLQVHTAEGYLSICVSTDQIVKIYVYIVMICTQGLSECKVRVMGNHISFLLNNNVT